MSRIPVTVVEDVYERAAGYCEACGGPLGMLGAALHHRLPRSAGGLDETANLMLVHGSLRLNCHNLSEYSIHQNPTRSYRLGHMVRRGMRPADIPAMVAADLRLLRA